MKFLEKEFCQIFRKVVTNFRHKTVFRKFSILFIFGQNIVGTMGWVENGKGIENFDFSYINYWKIQGMGTVLRP